MRRLVVPSRASDQLSSSAPAFHSGSRPELAPRDTARCLSVGMSKAAGKTLTEDQVLLFAKALGERRRYEIVKRLGERPDALTCCAVRDCTGINPATLSHHMKELEIAGLVD